MSVADDMRLMTVPEVASAIRVSAGTVYRWIEENRVPSIRVGNAVRIPRRWLDRMIAEAERASESKSGPASPEAANS